MTLASGSFPIPSARDPALLGPLLRCLPYFVGLLSCPVLWKRIFTISSLHVDKGCDLLKVTEPAFWLQLPKRCPVWSQCSRVLDCQGVGPLGLPFPSAWVALENERAGVSFPLFRTGVGASRRPLDQLGQEEEVRSGEGVLSAQPAELVSSLPLRRSWFLCCQSGEGSGLWPRRRPQVFVHEHVLAGESTGLRKPVDLSLGQGLPDLFD